MRAIDMKKNNILILIFLITSLFASCDDEGDIGMFATGEILESGKVGAAIIYMNITDNKNFMVNPSPSFSAGTLNYDIYVDSVSSLNFNASTVNSSTITFFINGNPSGSGQSFSVPLNSQYTKIQLESNCTFDNTIVNYTFNVYLSNSAPIPK